MRRGCGLSKARGRRAAPARGRAPCESEAQAPKEDLARCHQPDRFGRSGSGTDGSGADAAYLKNSPVEITEAEAPVRILRYGLMPDTGGPGGGQ